MGAGGGHLGHQGTCSDRCLREREVCSQAGSGEGAGKQRSPRPRAPNSAFLCGCFPWSEVSESEPARDLKCTLTTPRPRRASLGSPVPETQRLAAPPPPGQAALNGSSKGRGF